MAAEASRCLMSRPNGPQAATAHLPTRREVTAGCRPRLGDEGAARPDHHGDRGAAPLCVWSSTALRQFLRDRPRGTQVSNNEMSMMPSTGKWPPRARTPSTITCPPPAAHEPHPTWQGKPRRLDASQLVGVLDAVLQLTGPKGVYGAMWSDQDD